MKFTEKYVTKDEILALFNYLGVDYLINYDICYSKLLNIDLKSTPYYKDNLEEFNSLEETYGDYIKNRYVAPVFVAKTKKCGYGLFSLDKIKKGDFVGIYFGVVKPQRDEVEIDENGIETDYSWNYPDEYPNLPLLEVDAKPKGSEMRFANHSFKPNLDVEHVVIDNCWYIFFIANKNIGKNKELTISYGEEYWETEYRNLH
jgi:hypothetical protein